MSLQHWVRFATIALTGPVTWSCLPQMVDVLGASAAAAPWKPKQAPSTKGVVWAFHMGPFCRVPCGREASPPGPFIPSPNSYLGHTYYIPGTVLGSEEYDRHKTPAHGAIV